MGMWKSFSEDETTQDFARMREAGLDSVRLFLTWEDFQPTPDVVDASKLEMLVRVMDRAATAGLSVIPTLFTGHMSGVNWFPEWAVKRSGATGRFRVVCRGAVVSAIPLNWYEDDAVRGAQARLASACAARLSGHPALHAWDLGNENSNCVLPENRTSARVWLGTMTEALRTADPDTPITLGLHMEDLEENRRLTPQDAAEFCDFLTMHGYPGYASFTRDATDERLLPFLTQLTRFLGGGLDVYFSEFGVPTRAVAQSATGSVDDSSRLLVSEDDAARYVERGLRALQQSGATGAMLWCHSDYGAHLFSEAPFDRAAHERSFGLFRADGSAKPVVERIRTLSREPPLVSDTPRISESSFIDLTVDDYFDGPGRHLRRLFRRYCRALGESHPFTD